jgi:hypothetical protein
VVVLIKLRFVKIVVVTLLADCESIIRIGAFIILCVLVVVNGKLEFFEMCGGKSETWQRVRFSHDLAMMWRGQVS